MTGALELAERAVTAARDPSVLVRVTAERSLTLRFARSRPTQATAIEDVTVELCVLCDGHVGRAETNSDDREAFRACARSAREGAEAAARAAGAGPYPEFPERAAVAAPAREASAPDAAAGGAALEAAFAACAGQGLEAHGVWTAGTIDTAVAGVTGASAAERVSDAFMKVTAIAPNGRSGYAASTSPAAEALDPRGIADRAARKAAVSGDAERLVPGEYPVVLEAHAVADLAGWLGATALNGLHYAEGRSALSGRLGARVAAAKVTVTDVPQDPRTLRRAFDAEGVAKSPLALIEDGAARAVVHDTDSAARIGARSTGHAVAIGGAQGGPAPTNLVVSPGTARDETDLCRAIERGVYVTRLWYTNALRPKETLITGVTRDGTFLIEGGEITRPAGDLRLTDSVLGVLERCEELAAEPVLTSDGEFYGRRFAAGVVCPAMRSRMRFTA